MKSNRTFSNKPYIFSAAISTTGAIVLFIGKTYYFDYLQEHFKTKVFVGVFGASLIIAGGLIAASYLQQVVKYNQSHDKKKTYFFK